MKIPLKRTLHEEDHNMTKITKHGYAHSLSKALVMRMKSLSEDHRLTLLVLHGTLQLHSGSLSELLENHNTYRRIDSEALGSSSLYHEASSILCLSKGQTISPSACMHLLLKNIYVFSVCVFVYVYVRERQRQWEKSRHLSHDAYCPTAF